MPPASFRKLSFAWYFASTLLFDQHLPLVVQEALADKRDLQCEHRAVGLRLGAVRRLPALAVPVLPGELTAWMLFHTHYAIGNNPWNWKVFRYHSDRRSLRTQRRKQPCLRASISFQL